MQGATNRSVEIIEKGRYGSVVYRDPPASVSFYWEFGGGDAVAIIQVDDVAAWRAEQPWVAGQRAAILRFVADEVIRQKAPGSRAEIDEREGCIVLRQLAPSAEPRAPGMVSAGGFRTLPMKLAAGAFIVTAIVAALVWSKNKVFAIESRTGTPLGLSVRTDDHIATLIRALEPYTPTLHRDGSKDRFRVGVFVVPLDGRAPPRLIPIVGDRPPGTLQLAKILGSDGRTLWFDVAGIGGVDLRTGALVSAADLRRANPALDANWWEDARGMEVRRRLRLTSRDRQQALEIDPETRKAAPAPPNQDPARSPFAPTPATFLGAGLFTAPATWLGLHSPAEVERDFKPKSWLRKVVRADDTRAMRRFYHGVLDPDGSDATRKILSMTPLGNDEYFSAAFLRVDDRSEPLRLTAPDGALMAYTSAPGLKGTLMVARVDTLGKIQWKVDTGIDRWQLSQILPGERSVAFVGTRPMVPDKVSEPLLVIVDNRTGTVATHSLWQ